MSRSSDARKKRRQIKRSGVALFDRVVIDSGALAAGVVSGVNLIELVSYQVAEALGRLDAEGADVLAHTVVTIGEHPEYPGDLMIEAKCSNLKVEPPADDCDCPVDHSLDASDDELGG